MAGTIHEPQPTRWTDLRSHLFAAPAEIMGQVRRIVASMPKHSETFTQRRPSFDFLEARSLLSGGAPWTAGPGASNPPPPVPPIVAEQNPPKSAQQEGPSRSGGDWESSPNQYGSGQFVFGEQALIDTAQTGVNSGSGVFASSFTSPSGQAPSLAGPSVAFGSNTNSGPGSSSGLTLIKNPASVPGPDPGGPFAFNAQVANPVAGVPAGLNKEGGPEPGGAGASPINLALSAPPAQDIGLVGGDALIAARRLSAGETASGISNLIDGTGLGRGGSGGRSDSRSGVGTRVFVVPTDYVLRDAPEGNPQELPGPSSVDLLANALPFDRASLERAIDRCVQQLESLSAGDLLGQRPGRLAWYALTVTSAFAAFDMVRRRWRYDRTTRQGRMRDRLPVREHIGFPELPGSWSSRLS